MPNGKHGDHPLTDILHWRLEEYGSEADDLIRKIKSVSSDRELDEWWEKEIGWNCDPEIVLQKSKKLYRQLMMRAKESGWETDQ